MKDILVGCCGFPCNRKEYFKRFPIVEIQSTFYEPPLIDTAEKWREEAPEEFEFTIKAWQLITHETPSPTYRRLRTTIPENRKDRYGFFKPTEEVFKAWEKTVEVARVLRASIILFQCPPSFLPLETNIRNLRRFFEQIKRKGFLYAWEPRGSWPDELVRDICIDLGLIHCVDPFFKKPQSNLSINYFRLHGMPLYNLRYSYSTNDLENLLRLCDGKTYVFFNNLNMLSDSLSFIRMVNSKKGTNRFG